MKKKYTERATNQPYVTNDPRSPGHHIRAPQISGFHVERIHWHEITVWLWEFNYTPELGTAFLSQHQ